MILLFRIMDYLKFKKVLYLHRRNKFITEKYFSISSIKQLQLNKNNKIIN